MRLFSTGLLTFLAAMLSACSPSTDSDSGGRAGSGQTPTQVAEAFMQANQNEDDEAFRALLTTKARESVDAMDENSSFNPTPFDSYTIAEEKIENDSASVSIQAVKDGEPQNVSVKLRQDDGDWRVYALGMAMGPDAEFTINLENMGDMFGNMAESIGTAIAEGFQQSMDDWQQGGSEAEVAAKAASFDALAPISADEYEAAWKTSSDFRGQSRTDALSTLARELALSVYPGEHAAALAGDVTTDTRGLSRLEAIDKITAEVGLRPVFPDLNDYGVFQEFAQGLGDIVLGLVTGDDAVLNVKGTEAEALINEARAKFDEAKPAPKNAIRFEPAGDAPRAIFAGPFRVEVATVEENVPHATGSLNISAAAYGLPAQVLALAEDADECIHIDAVEDAKGRSLIEENVTYFGGGQVAGSALLDHANRDLKNLLRDVESIQRVPGAVTLALPAEVLEFDFTSLTPETSVAKGDYRVNVEEVGENSRFKVTGPEGWDGDIAARIQPYKADGSPLGVTFSDVSSWGGDYATANLNTPEAPARVRIKLVPKVETVEYPFDFGPIPLDHFAEMPEKLAELSFEGHDTPITLSLLDILDPDGQFGKVKLRIDNHSNKAPTSAFVDFVYQDAAGKEIDSFPHNLSGEFNAEGMQPLVPPNKSVDSEQTAFQMPAETKSIGFRLISLDFQDGTKWEAER